MYQVHRPIEISASDADLQLDPEQRFAFRAAKRSDTGGPLMVGTDVLRMHDNDVTELYQRSLGRARPCYRDEQTGYVHIGHFVFVPEGET